MKGALILTVAAAFAATPALACTPPRPGDAEAEPAPPSDSVIAKDLFLQSAEIAYGKVIRGSTEPGGARFKVLHVYKGALKPGTVLTVAWEPPMPCGGPVAPPAAKGATGVIGYAGRPKLDFIEQKWVDRMIADGWIKPRKR